MAEVMREVWKGPLEIIWGDGSRTRTERDVLIVDDWKDTVFGPVNFGFVHLGQRRIIKAPAEKAD